MEIALCLQMCGLMGEAHFDEDNVWIQKTHAPFDNELTLESTSNRMFFLMRNPLDVIPSHAALMNL